MDENLVGYLLNALDPAAREQVESRLRTEPQARQRLELLRQAIAPLEEDRDIQPPDDLVVKTLAHVAEHCCRELPRSPEPAPFSIPMSVPFWRRADVMVAAGLLFAVATLSFPLISHLKNQQAIQECKRNLSDFHLALAKYREVHRKAPNFAANDPPRNVAGMIAPILHTAEVLPSTASICCPATRGMVPCTTTLAKIGALTADEFQDQAPKLLPCYAYSLGYHDNGVYHCAMETPPDAASARVPLMADRPPLSGLGNSPNHGGGGQNVLFQDGHVEFVMTRNVGIDGDDIYLNRDMKIAAGVGCNDTVLGASASHP